MNNNPEQKDVASGVLDRIRAGEVHMKPRLYFIAKTALVVGLALLIILIATWLASFISFGLRLSGHELLLGFGGHWTYVFFILFPWGLAVLELFLIVLLIVLIRKFKFGYRQPMLYALVASIFISVLAGFVFDRETSFHHEYYERAEEDSLFEPLNSLYTNINSRTSEEYGVYRGTVMSIQETSFVLTHNDYDNDADDGTWTVSLPNDFNVQELQVGDRVLVVGEREDSTIEAFGIRTLDEDM